MQLVGRKGGRKEGNGGKQSPEMESERKEGEERRGELEMNEG